MTILVLTVLLCTHFLLIGMLEHNILQTKIINYDQFRGELLQDLEYKLAIAESNLVAQRQACWNLTEILTCSQRIVSEDTCGRIYEITLRGEKHRAIYALQSLYYVSNNSSACLTDTTQRLIWRELF